MNPKALSVVLLPVLAAGTYCLWPAGQEKSASASPAAETKSAALSAAKGVVTSPGAAAVLAKELDVAMAVEQAVLAAEFTGNGRDRVKLVALNKSDAPILVKVDAGQMFETDRDAVVVIRPGTVEVAPGRTGELMVQTAAARSSNEVKEAPYRLSSQTIPKIDLYLTYVQDHPDLSQSAVQTGVLALTDNLPLSAVAKFAMAGGALPSRFNTDPFRAETHDIIAALESLKKLGVANSELAMTIDPQLRIEAMIDPQTRPSAMRYYQIASEVEWEYWRSELLDGEPNTRHFALYGIARFYPEIALTMLPKWAREKRTSPLMRLSAIQALADTQRAEALPILRKLAKELGLKSDLGKAAVEAAEYLDYRLAQLAQVKTTVAFRNDQPKMQF